MKIHQLEFYFVQNKIILKLNKPCELTDTNELIDRLKNDKKPNI